MDNLKASFENVADWCEKHLEDKRGREGCWPKCGEAGIDPWFTTKDMRKVK
jgi:hypothetical protein